MDIQKKLQRVPSSPGIYLMKDSKGKVIYVGKAKNLKNRLKSYFHDSASLDTRKAKMVRETRDLDYVVTQNELEALALEANFIKRVKPRYNIILRDDKNYPYLRLTVHENWPRLDVTRRITKNGALYFGPYVPAGNMWEILRFVRRYFSLPPCKYNLEKPFRPCVQYQMGRCLAPCDESRRTENDRSRYMEIVDDVKLFLSGGKKELFIKLKQRMKRLSDQLMYEDAAKLRDRLKAMERVWEAQRVISPGLGDLDVIGMFRKRDEASLYILFVRNGMVVGQKDFYLKKLDGLQDEEILLNFIEQFYAKEILLPPKVILPLRGNYTIQKQWLSSRRGAPVKLKPARGEREREVLKMAMDNAVHAFERQRGRQVSGAARETLVSLKKILNLQSVPKRIEAVDISNISGAEAVGAVVVWEEGDFVKDDYRLFRIKTVQGIDDFAMIEEVVGRHCKGLKEGRGTLPQLILIDGGRGQLASALRAMKPFALPIEIAAIAKAKRGEPERLFSPGIKDAIPLDPSLELTRLLQRIRDEVHRVAITYHKKLRVKRTLESPLKNIKGIGKTRRLLLLRRFGDINAIREASVDEIASLKGINRKTATLLKEYLGGTK
jgi:excinuclease ABC subunit C